MKNHFSRFVALGLALLCFAGGTFAAESSAKADLAALVGKIQARLAEGANTEKALAAELAEFEALREKYRADKTEDVAQILVMQGALYAQVLENDDKAIAIFEQLKKDFPKTQVGAKAGDMIESIKQQAETNKLQRALAVGTKFPEFSETDLAGKPVSLAALKGKVVLIDFWATWCGPCIGELPNVIAAYEKHHPNGFEIVGITLDDAAGRQKLLAFLKDQKMSWPQVFDGKGWQSKLAVKHGVNSIPATYLLDGEGTIVAKNLRGPALEEEVARLLKK